MVMHYVDVNGVRGTAMGGLLVDLNNVESVGIYWPATDKESAYFEVMLEGGKTVRATFDSSVPTSRHLEEHARLVKELVKKWGITGDAVPTGIGDGTKTIKEIDFEPAEKTYYDTTDPDGSWLMTGRVLGAFVAYLYQQEKIAPDDRKEDESEQDIAIRLAEEFAVKALGDSMAMDEFAEARASFVWNEMEDDPSRMYAEGFGKPL